jgi:hypothetical protein
LRTQQSSDWLFRIKLSFDWSVQMELATGKFPYGRWKNPFQQLKQVVEDPSPQLPPGVFSEDFEDFIRKW